MNFIRGDNHQEKFRFKTFTGNIKMIYFTVKCKNKYPRIKKRLGDGIELVEGWYIIDFKPEDTDELSCDLTMEYDIEIITEGNKYTVQKGSFTLEEDVTTPDCEV